MHCRFGFNSLFTRPMVLIDAINIADKNSLRILDQLSITFYDSCEQLNFNGQPLYVNGCGEGDHHPVKLAYIIDKVFHQMRAQQNNRPINVHIAMNMTSAHQRLNELAFDWKNGMTRLPSNTQRMLQERDQSEMDQKLDLMKKYASE